MTGPDATGARRRAAIAAGLFAVCVLNALAWDLTALSELHFTWEPLDAAVAIVTRAAPVVALVAALAAGLRLRSRWLRVASGVLLSLLFVGTLLLSRGRVRAQETEGPSA